MKAHLTQLFVQSGGPGLGGSVALGTEHLLVPVNEVAVAQSDHLHADAWTWGNRRGDLACLLVRRLSCNVSSPNIKRDGHHGVENDDVRPEGQEC